jgi:hypothetical protein
MKTDTISSHSLEDLRNFQFLSSPPLHGLRGVDIIECLLQLYCWNKLVVLYSYDNKSCVHAKHIVIMSMFYVVKRRKVSKIKS